MGYTGNFTHIFVDTTNKSRQPVNLIKHSVQISANIENNGEIF